ncbi:hypothetical protein CLAFUW4_06293 [Fulvia fulva]|uniref:Uncharacterized protein n=1 Tax=Passalora fulva TaxID=5499 RepID=A0A9Q8P8H9_PASFU|nr:uncharacterized protein CLAFUR5_06436 [Fulvia fulva]KAK4624180.1 hypothetical protein CLAFUR4_06296 [Fulvia fulva]KAK4625691.1 hypothetical protein CLAFUR0_06300 [Fulvia fulva]UJO17250.1 hypothetical protein CLAFUR5_06436 [Fulvia fulva]WPV15582.1 hypothetical protein CLAFUW4_06293 [Fulvia fulva]WPV30515.1 hypothetical protein CLAFUW7_06289 [Fulvia fulva]
MAWAKVIESFLMQQLNSQSCRDKDLGHLMDATHQAVGSYFYRRIYSMDAGVLQRYVADVRDSLRSFECANPEKGFATVRLIWPAYIAACEAETPELRAFFAQWFERLDSKAEWTFREYYALESCVR